MNIEVVQDDITALDVDAIVHAANSLPDRVLLCAFNESMATLYRDRLLR
jgi:hypothetical protein